MVEKNNSTAVKIISILCIIIPPLGALGIHDFVVGRKKYGIAHIAMILLPVILSIIVVSIVDITVERSDSIYAWMFDLVLIMWWIIILSSVSSYIWAIIECIMILKGRIMPTNNFTRKSKKRTL